MAEKSAANKVVFCLPVVDRPRQETLDSLEKSLPLLDAAGIDHAMVSTVHNPYISAARSKMLRQALDAGAGKIIFIDHDLSWRPEDLLKLVQTDGDAVGGTYRFKKSEIEYMGQLMPDAEGFPRVRSDGALLAHSMPAGFLKITRDAVNRFSRMWPELLYGEAATPHVDLFNHGAHGGIWYGEDYAFCRRWIDRCGELWCIPDLDLTHWSADGIAYPGNYHEYLKARPGGELYVCNPS